ncbi:STAS domain-containing protein [Streptomyces vinaceus]|uniref:STAS domain-containing protein n=1 Tax=Streptomyces vinaceus TaxID=1960 RepID=UPI0035D7CA65
MTTTDPRPDGRSSQIGNLSVYITEAGTPSSALRLSGSLSANTAGLLQGIGPDHSGFGQHRFVLDVSEVSYCDSAGLRSLVDLRRRMSTAGIRVFLTGVPPELRRLADRTRLACVATAPQSPAPAEPTG